MLTFILAEQEDGYYCFFLNDRNGKVLLSSEPYQDSLDCEKGVRLVKKSNLREFQLEFFEEASVLSFVLFDTKGRPLAHSGSYKSAEEMNEVLMLLRKEVREAEVRVAPKWRRGSGRRGHCTK